MTISEYRHLKQQIQGAAANLSDLLYSQLVANLKNRYEKTINSRRALEQIDRIPDLLNVLEKRDELSEDNVEPFIVIARRLPDSDELMERISEYQSRHVERDYVNYYSANNSHHTTVREQSQNILNCHQFGLGVSETKMKRIRDIIMQIGTSWRNLGRNLTEEIREWDLDKIDCTHDRLEDKILGLMLLYEQRADPQRWFMILCNALDKSRRPDIRKLIQNIMALNI